MKPSKPMLTSGQKPLAKDSLTAFALLMIGLFIFLPWWKALLALGLLFGIAFPFVLIERQMIFAYNDGRPWRHWPWVACALTAPGLAAILMIDLHRWGMLSWWP